MVGKAEAEGLIFDPAMKAEVMPAQSTPKYAAANAAAEKNESLTGLWWIVEYLPKPYKDPANDFKPSWMLHRGRPRHVNPKAKVHTSVFQRMKLVAGYRPPNLPVDAEEVQ
jgi:hypothetical protein